MKQLFLVRHGEVDFNAEGRYFGKIDVELNKKGLRQANDIAKKMIGLKINVIVASPLKRCRNTADIISGVISAPVVLMDEFRERAYGVFEGLTRKEAKNKYPELWAKNITRIYNGAPPGGETIKEAEARVYKGLKKIKIKYPDKIVLIVTHAFVGKIIHRFFYKLTDEEFFEYRLDNAEIVKYDFA